MIDLRYAAPAKDVSDIVSIYYYGFVRKPFSGTERAAIAQLRFHLGGAVKATMKSGKMFLINHSVVQGPTTGPTRYDLQKSSRFVGCGLLPCGWDALLGRSAADHANEVLPFTTQMMAEADALEDRLVQADDFDEMVPILDDMARMLKKRVDDNIRNFVSIVDGWLMASPSPDVADLYTQLALSSRQVERLVKYLYGAPPKFIARKFRALRAARQLKLPGTSAGEAFYDQSHMIRELKHFTGETPSDIQLDADKLTQLIEARAELGGDIHPLTVVT